MQGKKNCSHGERELQCTVHFFFIFAHLKKINIKKEKHFRKQKAALDTTTHQHIHIEHPAVFSSTYAEALQINAAFVVEDFVEGVTQLRAQLLTPSALKLGGRIGRTEEETTQ